MYIVIFLLNLNGDTVSFRVDKDVPSHSLSLQKYSVH